MRRILLLTLAGLATLVLALVALVTVRASGVDELPSPDAELPIQLADGGELPLREVVERARRGLPLLAHAAPVEPLAVGDAGAESGLQGGVLAGDPRYPGMPWGAIFALAERHRQAGRLDQALALFQSIPEGDPDYSIARRRIALAIVTSGRGDPASAVPYAHAALASEPFDANSWQDLARVYSATLGLDTEGWD